MKTLPMNFSAYLEAIPENIRLLITPEGTLTRDEIVLNQPIAKEKLLGSRIGLKASSLYFALPVLTAIDGLADIVLLLPESLPTQQMEALAAQLELDAVLCDTGPESCANSTVPVLGSIDALTDFLKPRSAPVATRWILVTSGTTGKPKMVAHPLASLVRTTRINYSRSSTIRWGLLYDYSRFAGLQVVLQSVLSGAMLLAPPANTPLMQKIAFFSQHNCTHMSGTPTIWRKIVMMPEAQALCLQQITLGGEIADDRILSTLSAHYPQARIVHIFASTEAGVAFSVSDRRAGFPVSYLSDPPNVDIGIKVENNKLHICNKNVVPTYLGCEDRFATADGWVDTGDIVDIRQDRVFFKGRESGAINVGGDKFYPEEIEDILMSHHLVCSARVYARKSPITGSLVVADVVLLNDTENIEYTKNILYKFVQGKLGRLKSPAIIKIVTELQTNSTGKVSRF